MTTAHEEKMTISVDVNIPAHADRTTTPLFTRTRKDLIAREGGRCWICGRTAEEAGPLEAHHYPVERCLTEMVDWALIAIQAERGDYGPNAQAFDWTKMQSPYDFVDNMLYNGLLLCKEHHTGRDAGIHFMPHADWIAQRFGKAGYQYTPTEVLIHESDH